MPKSDEFKKLKSNILKEYLGEPVPSEYIDKYGKVYNKKDIESMAFAIAKSKGIKID